MPNFRYIVFQTGHCTMAILTLCLSMEQLSHHPLHHIGRTVSRWNASIQSIDTRHLLKTRHRLTMSYDWRELPIRLRGGCADDMTFAPETERSVIENSQISTNGPFRLCVRRMDSEAGRESDYRLIVSG